MPSGLSGPLPCVSGNIIRYLAGYIKCYSEPSFVIFTAPVLSFRPPDQVRGLSLGEIWKQNP